MKGSILLAGTASDVGKSSLVSGLCRLLHRRGVAVAPFKAQNMALNAAVAADGGEIGRAQAAQAGAAGIPSETAMNPILIKPTGHSHSQVIVMGKPAFDAGARDYLTRKQALLPVVVDALDDLRSRFDVVVCEGAGGAAEINLRAADLTNLGLARAANLPVVIIADIDRGGALASLYGTLALLEPADQALVGGFIINRFRGDPEVLRPGLDQLEQLTGRPCLGVLPHLDGLEVDAEDSLSLDTPRTVLPPIGSDGIEVAVVRLPKISNFTDMDALATEPGVSVRFTAAPGEVRSADLAILPGSKHTIGDLRWLREHGLDRALADRVDAGRPVLGICGGYQMLGDGIVDDVESGVGAETGLGFLPVRTTFHPDKTLRHHAGTSPWFGSAPAQGYSIRHGRVERHGAGAWLLDTAGVDEGCRSGAVFGTSWHGLMESDRLRRAFLSHVAELAGLHFAPGDHSFESVRQARFDRLADMMAEHCDVDALVDLIEHGAPVGLPIAPPGGAPAPRSIPALLEPVRPE